MREKKKVALDLTCSVLAFAERGGATFFLRRSCTTWRAGTQTGGSHSLGPFYIRDTFPFWGPAASASTSAGVREGEEEEEEGEEEEESSEGRLRNPSVKRNGGNS